MITAPIFAFGPSLSIPTIGRPSACRTREERAGHGKMLDAATVTIDATKVRPKSEVTKERRCALLIRSCLIISPQCISAVFPS